MASSKDDKEKALILIDENYAISVDGIDYSLRKIRYNKKSGKRETETVGYFSSVQKCLEHYAKEAIHDGLKSDADITLKEAINTIRDTWEGVEKIIHEVCPEYMVVEK